MAKQNLVLGTGAIKNAQQDRKGAVEHDKRQKSTTTTGVVPLPRKQYISPIGDRVCMFLAGASAASAVHFFNDLRDIGLIIAILCSVMWIHVSMYFGRKHENSKGRYLK